MSAERGFSHEQQMQSPAAPSRATEVDPVQRALASAQSRVAQRKALTASIVQRREGIAVGADEVQSAAAEGVRGSGSTLPHLDAIQASFGRHDVSGVGAHVGGAAGVASRQIGAQAYATGDQVAFAQQPDLHLAAHEAAHVVQQRSGVQLKGGVGQAGDPYEQHADAVADAVVRGESAEELLDTTPGSGGATDGTQRQSAGPSTAEMAAMVRQRLEAARAQGAAAVVAEAKALRTQADTPQIKAAVEEGINSTLTQEERDLLAGKGSTDEGSSGDAAEKPTEPGTADTSATTGTTPSGQDDTSKDGTSESGDGTNEPGTDGKGTDGKGTDGKGTDDKGADGKGTDDRGADDKGADGEGADGKGADGKGADGKGADGKGADGKGADGKGAGGKSKQATPHDGTGGAAPPPVTTAQALEPAVEVAGDMRSSVQQELSYHEQWGALRGGAGQKALHLLKGLPGDGAAGLTGAAWQVGGALGTEFLAKNIPVPGLGNMIGGGFSAWWLAKGGGEQALTDLGEGWKALTSGDMGPMQRIADIVQMVKSMMDLVGNVCNVLSGLAYAFSAIAALGGLLSVFFPPLAFLVPYIPTAVNFGRMCGGVAQVCIAVSNIISPIPPAFRALHIITSNDDPIKLVEQENQYRGELRGAIANYASAGVLGGKQAYADGKAGGATGKSLVGQTLKGANPLKVMGGGLKAGVATTKESFADMKAGNAGVREAIGFGSKTDAELRQDGSAMGKGYFGGNDALLKLEQKTATDQKEKDLKAKQDEITAKQEELAEAQKALDDVKKEYPRYNPNKSKKGSKPQHYPNNGKNKLTRYNNLRGQAIGEAKGRINGLESEIAQLQQQHTTLMQTHTGKENQIAGHRQTATGRGAQGDVQGEAGAALDAARGVSPGAEPGQVGSVELERDKKGHVVLPEPPGSLVELDSLDDAISGMQQTLSAQQGNTAAASAHAQSSEQNAAQLEGLKGEVDRKKDEIEGTSSQHQAVEQQNTDAKTKKDQAGGKGDTGLDQAANALAPIAGPLGTVNSVVQKVPSNRFFNVSGTQKNLAEMTKAVDEITGAGGDNKEQQTAADKVITERSEMVCEAKTQHGDNTAEVTTLAGKVEQDAATTKLVAADSATQAKASEKAEMTIQQQIEEKKREKAQKWSALQSWAARHYAMRIAALQQG